MTIEINKSDEQFFDFKLSRFEEVAAEITTQARTWLDRIDREVANAVKRGERHRIPDIVTWNLAQMNANLRTDILIANVSEIAQIVELKLKGKM